MASRYRLVFRGQYRPGIEPGEVIVNLAQLFSVSKARFRYYFQLSPLLSSAILILRREINT
jgi:hypothetical protein